jgi:hypothetical protein
MARPKAIPERLYIEDVNERIINLLVDECFKDLINEVEAEEAQRLTDEALIAETGSCTGS